MSQFRYLGRVGVIFFTVFFLFEPARASLEANSRIQSHEPSEAELASQFTATNAILYDRETGKGICQFSVAGRRDLAPTHLFAVDEQGPVKMAGVRLPICDESQLEILQYTSAHAQLGDSKSALLGQAVVGLTCVIGALAGVDFALYFERRFDHKRRTQRRTAYEDLNIAGTGGGAVVGAAEYLTRLGAVTVDSIWRVTGLGAFCGGVAGLTTYAVAYFSAHGFGLQE